jgi:hypothetical protein
MINECTKHRRSPRTVKEQGKPSVEQLVESEDMEFGPKGFRLGTLKEIHSRNAQCPLCRLVTKSLYEQAHEKPLLRNEKGEEIPLTDQDVNEWPEKEAVCYASWQVDGRILRHDQNGNISESRACTRRIRLHWHWPKFFDSYIVLMASSSRETPGLFLGRTLHNAQYGVCVGPDLICQPRLDLGIILRKSKF